MMQIVILSLLNISRESESGGCKINYLLHIVALDGRIHICRCFQNCAWQPVG